MTTFRTTVSTSTASSIGFDEMAYPSTISKTLINNTVIDLTDYNNSEINSIFQSSILYSTFATNNTTVGVTDDGSDLMQNVIIQAFFSIFYIIFFVLGIFGNSLVCFVVFRQKTMQTVTNFFITNLAIADVLLCLLCVPFTPLYTFMGTWVFGSALCFLVAFAQGCCVYLSTLTLTSIAIDRFFVIIFPFRPRMKIRTCFLIIILIWIIACALTFPYGLYMKLISMNYMNAERTLCEEKWPSEDFRKVFGAVTSILQFFLPFLIILFCYLCIFCKLKNNKKKLTKSKNSKKKNSCERILKKKTTTNQMLVLMVILFGMCWLPLNLINILEDFYMKTTDGDFYHVLFFLSHLIAMSSVIYNPFLYAWLNENFRKEFKQILPCFFLKISGNSHETRRSILLNTKNDENLIKNGNDKTLQESTYMNSMQKSFDVEGTTLAMTTDTKNDEILINIEIKEPMLNNGANEPLHPPPVTTTKFKSGMLETTLG